MKLKIRNYELGFLDVTFLFIPLFWFLILIIVEVDNWNYYEKIRLSLEKW